MSPSELRTDGAVVAKSPQKTALGARVGGGRTPLRLLGFAPHGHVGSFGVASPLGQAVLGSVDSKAWPRRSAPTTRPVGPTRRASRRVRAPGPHPTSPAQPPR